MTFQNLFIPHELSADERAWLDTEIAEQQRRHAAIVAAMAAIEPQREAWYAEFLQRIQERGYSADGDQRVKIGLADIPVRPDRPHRVTY